MKEKEIIKAEIIPRKKTSLIIGIFGFIVALITLFVMANSWFTFIITDGCLYNYYEKDYVQLCKKSSEYADMSLIGFIMEENQNTYWIAFFSILAGFTILSVYYYYVHKDEELIVTNKRIYGKNKFKNKFDLSVNKISTCSTTIFKGIKIDYSSSKLKIKMIKNYEELSDRISKLIQEREENTNDNIKFNKKVSLPDELKKYKELLDSGAINQEEYKKIKKDLLK